MHDNKNIALGGAMISMNMNNICISSCLLCNAVLIKDLHTLEITALYRTLPGSTHTQVVPPQDDNYFIIDCKPLLFCLHTNPTCVPHFVCKNEWNSTELIIPVANWRK